MRISLVNNKYAYDERTLKRKDRYSSIYYLDYKALERLGKKYDHSVDAFWVDEAISEYGREGAREKFLEYILREKPDICIVRSVERDVGHEVLEKLQDQSNTTMVYLCGDDAWRWHRVTRHFAKHFDWIITYDSQAVAKYKKMGCKNIIHHQQGVDPEVYKNFKIERDIDVSFIGAWTKRRGRVVKYLRENGVPVFVRGRGWPDGPVSQEEMVDIHNRSKISLTLNPSPFYISWRSIGRLFFRRAYLGEKGPPYKFDTRHFFDNVREWLSKRRHQVKARHFETPMCGAMEITQDADDLKDYYKFGEEIVIYKDNKDLVRKIKYYLNHQKEREEIARRGYERSVRDHASTRRFEDIFEAMGRPFASASSNKAE